MWPMVKVEFLALWRLMVSSASEKIWSLSWYSASSNVMEKSDIHWPKSFS